MGKRMTPFSSKLLVENYHFHPTGLHVPTGGRKASPDFGAFCCKYHSYTRGRFFLPYILRRQDSAMVSKTSHFKLNDAVCILPSIFRPLPLPGKIRLHQFV